MYHRITEGEGVLHLLRMHFLAICLKPNEVGFNVCICVFVGKTNRKVPGSFFTFTLMIPVASQSSDKLNTDTREAEAVEKKYLFLN